MKNQGDVAICRFFRDVGSRRSRAYLSVLSLFLSPKDPDHVYLARETEKVIGQSAFGGALDKAINRLKKERLLQELSSGVLVCSTEGRKLAENYLIQEKRLQEDEKRIQAQTERAIIVSLEQGSQREAWDIFVDYEKNQVLKSDCLIYGRSDTLKLLKRVLEAKPGILAGVGPSDLDKLRVSAALMCLFDCNYEAVSLPSPQLPTAFNAHSAAIMVLNFVKNRQFIESQPKRVFKSDCFKSPVIVEGGQQCCSKCAEFEQHQFSRVGDLPELPYPECTSKEGCSCRYSSVITPPSGPDAVGRALMAQKYLKKEFFEKYGLRPPAGW